MKIFIFVLIINLMPNLCFAEATYEKLNNEKFKETKTITTTKETVYSIEKLLRWKTELLQEIEQLKIDYQRDMDFVTEKLTEIKVLIKKAKELEIE